MENIGHFKNGGIMSEELLPCPFCGGIADYFKGLINDVVNVECTTCEADTPDMHHSKASAASQWNTRHLSKDIEADSKRYLEALEKIATKDYRPSCHNMLANKYYSIAEQAIKGDTP
jgi:Lar family restriction alleviation protein